jgi:DNA invertase Pin-like site-specific DNA recombinase
LRAAVYLRACDPDHPCDVIVVHSFSRFFRDGATMELTIRKLRRHGVEVVSMTLPTGTDPSQEMKRQIIGIFDEYTSKENGKNVTRARAKGFRMPLFRKIGLSYGRKIRIPLAQNTFGLVAPGRRDVVHLTIRASSYAQELVAE